MDQRQQQHHHHQQPVAAHRLFNDVGHAASAPVNRCWGGVGSVDVEDLALFFGDTRDNNEPFVPKSYANPHHRVFRNRNGPVTIAPPATLRNPQSYVHQFRNNSVTAKEDAYYGCEYEGRCYQECVQNAYPARHQQQQQQHHHQDYVWRYGTGNKNIERSSGHVEHELPLGLGLPCTEDQWLACPATNCPVFDNVGAAASPTTSWRDDSANQNPWNFQDTRAANFGPVLPPCIINETCFDIHSGINVYPSCYSRWEEEQQFFEDYLSNEKRKEKSRDAARCRRSRETDIFTELAGVLPLEPDQAAHLDKASVMRLAIAYLKVRSVIDSLEEPLTKTETMADMDAFFPKALDGFMLVLSSNGDMVYLSENVSEYLGVSQMDMMGQSVYEYSHPCDHDELRDCLAMKPSDVKEKRPCNFFLRLKCTLTSKGRKVNLKSASYKVIHCTGRVMGTFETNAERPNIEGANRRDGDSSDSQSSDERDSDIGCGSGFGYSGASLVIVGCPIPHPSNIEVPLGRQTFLSKHSLNMKFTYADDRLAEYLGWSSGELLGKSVFEFHHALDNAALDKSFKSLFSKGQCETTAYRFLGKTGGYAWVVTQATLIHCSKQHKPLSVVCVNHILSGIECEDEVYSQRQLKARKAASVNDRNVVVTAAEDLDAEDPLNLQSLPSLVLETPSATNTDDSLDGENEEAERAASDSRKKKRIASLTTDYANDATVLETTASSYKAGRARPQAVTASIFKSQAGLASQDSRKEPSSVAPKPAKNSDNRRERSAWFFQDKPILDYEPPPPPPRNPRPQAVTRNLFVPLCSIQDPENQQAPQYEHTVASRPTPQTTTASIFAPRTEDMNTGFLIYSEDQAGLTMLKDEPEDLTHLAPTPGDVCVPLEDTPFLSDDMLDDFILGNENYCPLLSPEGLPSELPNSDLGEPLAKDSSDVGESHESSLADGDPFIYRDIPSPCSLSPGLLSPADAASATGVDLGKSPERSSVDSLQSTEHSEIVDGMMTIGSGSSVGNPITEDEMLMLSINDVIADDELALRAPYIPMSDQDETLQLLISDETVMWGPSQPPDKKPKWYHAEEEKPISKRYDDSSLARLLKNESGFTKYNDHGGGLVDPVEIFGQISKGNTSNSSRLERPSKRVHAAISPSVPNESKRGRFHETKMPTAAMLPGGLSPGLPSAPQSAARGLNSGGYEEQSIDLCSVLATEEKLEPSSASQLQRGGGGGGGGGGSQLLLQQLMSRDHVQQQHSTVLTKSHDPTSLSRTSTGLLTTVEAKVAVSTQQQQQQQQQQQTASIERKKKVGGSFGDGGGTEATATDPATPRGQRQSNSVLMNLLVSGCDKASGLTMPQLLTERWSPPMNVDKRADSQLVPTAKNRAGLSYLDEYAAVNPIAVNARSSGGFGNYFNGNNADILLRSNMPETATIIAHSRYVK